MNNTKEVGVKKANKKIYKYLEICKRKFTTNGLTFSGIENLSKYKTKLIV